MLKNLLLPLLAVTFYLPGPVQAQDIDATFDVYNGHFSREGNNDTPSQTTKNNIYIKLYPDNWIALLYVPFPYGKSVTADMIDRVFVEARRQIKQRSFTRNTFAILDEPATVHMEKWEQVDGQTQFECGSSNPCALRFGDDYLEMVKSGIINEHIIKFNHVVK